MPTSVLSAVCGERAGCARRSDNALTASAGCLLSMFAEFYWGHSPVDCLHTGTETHGEVAYVGDDDFDLDPFCMNVSYSCQLLLDRLLTGDGFAPALIPWGKPEKDLSGMCQWCRERGVAGTMSCEHRAREAPRDSSHHGWDLFMAPAIDNDIVDNDGVGTFVLVARVS